MRVFYVISPADEILRAYFDGIRFIANPNEKDCAHVTLRGPYRQRYKMDALNRNIIGADVKVTGVDTFWAEGRKLQNTIFFSCASDELRRVWRKPDYHGFHPHLTIYDGPSRDLAQALLAVLKAHSWQLQFPATGLEALVSNRGQMSLRLRESLDLSLLSRAVDMPLTLKTIEDFDPTTRLDCVDRLCRQLIHHVSGHRLSPMGDAKT